MRFIGLSHVSSTIFILASLIVLLPAAFAQVSINNPASGSSVAGPVPLNAFANESVPFHMEVWDNGNKLANIFSNSVSNPLSLAQGGHVTTILAVSNNGVVLDSSSVAYQVVASAGVSAAPVNGVTISSPAANANSIHEVRITASASQSNAVALSIWDNGYKLGDVFASTVNGVYVLPSGAHTITVQALANDWSVLGQANVSYTVAENCANSGTVQCDMDQEGTDNSQYDCNPKQETVWVANPCGPGVQGDGGAFPYSTLVEQVYTGGTIPNQGNDTLNGHSLHLQEVQGKDPSNTLFRGESQSTTSTSAVDAHWTMDEYVYLPDPTAHQAFEMDAQASIQGIWTKFYTECAFNVWKGTGYWAVFDTSTGGWIFLNGQTQNGQTPPTVPCNRSQFSQPWPNSSNPSFTGWHHIAWTFLRNGDGTVTFQTLTFDGNTTQINFRPNSGNGGAVNDNGRFSALIQLDGVVNNNRKHDLLDAFVDEVTITHTP